MGLEIQTGKTPGEEIRRTEATRPPFIGFLILSLTGIIMLFATLIMQAIYNIGENGWPEAATLSASTHDPAIPDVTVNLYFQKLTFFLNEQVIVSFWLACLFFSLFFLTLLYQRFYIDHVTIAKKRFRKWEDEGVQL